MPVVLLEIVLLVLVGLVGYYVGRSTAARAAVDAETVEKVRHEIIGLRSLVARIKDLAWDNRELDPPLATIIIDEIRTYEKKELEP